MESRIACEEFAKTIAEAVALMAAEWDEARRSDPETFPSRMSARDWWAHFSGVVYPDLLLSATAPPLHAGDRTAAVSAGSLHLAS